MLEIERRFLIALPLTWYAKFKLLSCKKTNIRQVYLKNKPDAPIKTSHTRLRCQEFSGGNGSTLIRYTQTTKNFVSPGINEEIEFEITQKQYIDELQRCDFSKRIIHKTRYVIPFSGKKFELDIYKADLEALATMEVELDQLDEPICLPHYFDVIQEITGIEKYSNYGLASMSNYELPKLAALVSRQNKMEIT